MASPITEDAFPSLLESSYRKVDRQPPPRRVTPPPASEKAQEAPQPTPSDEDNGRKGPPRGSNPQPVRLGDFLSNRQVRFLNNQGRGNDSRNQPRPPPTAAVLVPRLDVNVKKTVNPKATEKLYYQTPTDEAKPPQRKPKQNNGNAQGRNRNGPAAAGNNSKSNANGEATGQNGSASRSGSRQKGPRNQNRGSGNAAEGGQNLSSEEVSKQQTSQRGIPAITNAAELHSPTNQHDNSKQPKKNRQARPQPRNEHPAQNDSKSDSHQNPSASTTATTTSTTTTTADANPVANSPKPKRNRRKNDKKAMQEGSTNTPTSTPAPSPLPTPTPSQESVQNNSEAPASPAQPKKQHQKTKYVLKAKENNTVAAENPQLPLENAASSSEQVPVASGDVQQNTPPAKRNNKPKKGKTNKLPEPASAGALSESVSAEVAEPTPAPAAVPEPPVASDPEPVVEAAVEATAQATVESVVEDAVAEAAKEEVEPQLKPQIEVAEEESQQPQALEEDEPCDIRPLDFIDDVPEPLKEQPAAVAVIHADQVAEVEPQPEEVLVPVKLEAELTSLPALSTPAPEEETPTPKPTETPVDTPTPKPVDTPTPKPFFTPLPYETPKPKDFITPYETPLPEELTQGKPQEPSFYGTGQLVVGGPNSAVPLIPMPSTAALPTTGTPSTISPRALVSLSSTPSPASSSPSSQEGTPVFPTPLPIPPLSNSVNLVEDYDKLINFSNVPVTKPKGVLTRVNSSSSLYLLSITNPSPSTSPLPSPRGAPSTVPSFNFTPLETPASITRIVSAPPTYDITSKSAPVTPATSPRATRKGSLTNRAGSKGLLHLF